MKHFLIPLLFSFSALAAYSSKPQMIARYAGLDSFNAPAGMICFTSEPHATHDGVYLGCQNANGFLMARWSPNFSELATSENAFFSKPQEVNGVVSWYEFNEGGLNRAFETRGGMVHQVTLKNLGPYSALIDSFLPVKNNFYIYRLQDESRQILIWKNHQTQVLFNSDSYIFPPVTSVEGNFIAKIRKYHLGEDAPDELMYWDGQFRTILKDRDADINSRWVSFRHQYALDKQELAFIGVDSTGEGIFLLKGKQLIEVARAGRHLKSFDYFSPKLRNGILAFRGVDHQNRKAVWVYEGSNLRKLITQGDVVQTDKGPARVDYQSQDALFYGAPGIGPRGEIYQQATLTAAEDRNTLLGIGLLKFNRE